MTGDEPCRRTRSPNDPRTCLQHGSRIACHSLPRCGTMAECTIGRRMDKSTALAILGLLAASAAGAVDVDSELPEVLVISATPVPGMNIDIDKVPGAVQSLSIADL